MHLETQLCVNNIYNIYIILHISLSNFFSLNISDLSILIYIHIQFSSYRLFHFMNNYFSTYLSISFSMDFLPFLFSHFSLLQKVLQSTSFYVSVVSVFFYLEVAFLGSTACVSSYLLDIAKLFSKL